MLQVLKMAKQMDLRKEMSKQLTTPHKYTGFRAAIAAEVKIGFWFGIGVIFGTGVEDSLIIVLGC